MKKIFLSLFAFSLFLPVFGADGTVLVIDKIAPKNAAFVGVVDSSQSVTNVTNFNNNLSSSDDTVQKALDTLDNLSVTGGGGASTLAVSSNNVVVSSPTSNINLMPPFIVTLQGSTSAQVTLNSSSVTLQGNTFNGANQLLKLDASGAISLSSATLQNVLYVSTIVWLRDGTVQVTSPTAGGSGTPGGVDTQLQYNDGGSFGGAASQYDDSVGTFTFTGAVAIDTPTVAVGVGANRSSLSFNPASNVPALHFKSYNLTATEAGLEFNDSSDNNYGDFLFAPQATGHFRVRQSSSTAGSVTTRWSIARHTGVHLFADRVGNTVFQIEPEVGNSSSTLTYYSHGGVNTSTQVLRGWGPGVMYVVADSSAVHTAQTGVINTSTNPVDWSLLKNVPAGFADGSDDGSGGGSSSGTNGDVQIASNSVFGSATNFRYSTGTSSLHVSTIVVGGSTVSYNSSSYRMTISTAVSIEGSGMSTIDAGLIVNNGNYGTVISSFAVRGSGSTDLLRAYSPTGVTITTTTILTNLSPGVAHVVANSSAVTTALVSLSTEVTGILQSGNFPTLAGDVSNSGLTITVLDDSHNHTVATSTFGVTGGTFTVTGGTISVNGIPYRFPQTRGSSTQVLSNGGESSGVQTLSWATAGGGSTIYNATSTAGFPFGASFSTISMTSDSSSVATIKRASDGTGISFHANGIYLWDNTTQIGNLTSTLSTFDSGLRVNETDTTESTTRSNVYQYWIPGSDVVSYYGNTFARQRADSSVVQASYGLRDKIGEERYFFIEPVDDLGNRHSTGTFHLNVSTFGSSQGFLGLGISTPTAKLHVAGTGLFTSTVTFNQPITLTSSVVNSNDEIGFDRSQDRITIWGGSGASGGISASTGVAIPLKESKNWTMFNPDLVYAISSSAPVITVSTSIYPQGIKVTRLQVDLSTNTVTCNYALYRATATINAPFTLVDAITLTNQASKEEVTISNPEVPGGYHLFAVIDGCVAKFAKWTVEFYAKY